MSNNDVEYAFFRLKDATATIFTDFYYCREEFASLLWQWYADNCVRKNIGNDLKIAICRVEQSKDYSGNSLRDVSDEAVQKRLNKIGAVSVHVINMFEKAVKWPLTEVYEGEMDLPDNKNRESCAGMLLFRSSAQWRMSPQLFSLLTLMIRCGSHDSIAKCKDVRAIVAKLNALSSGKDHYFYKRVQDWLLLMRKAGELYEPVFRNNWEPKDYAYRDVDEDNNYMDDFPIHEGLSYLLEGTSDNKELVTKFKILRKEEKNKVKAKAG
jgi:hypothetical protein